LGIKILITQKDKDLFLSIMAKYSGQSCRQAMVTIKKLLAAGKKLQGMKPGDVIF